MQVRGSRAKWWEIVLVYSLLPLALTAYFIFLIGLYFTRRKFGRDNVA